MDLSKVVHGCAHAHGLLGDLPTFEAETARNLRWLCREGYVERRERTVDIKPQSYAGNWPEMQPVGLTTIVTWHLTSVGQELWLVGKL